MNILKNKFFYIYLTLYLSMLLGCFLHEDLAVGTFHDYLIHIKKSKILNLNIIDTFLNYDDLVMPHSPVYLLYFLFINNTFGDFFGRLINMHLVLLMPIFTYLALSVKISLKNEYIKFLPIIFFISPYFRAGAFWIDDNVLAITFLTISIYFYLKSQKSKENILKFIFLNTLFLALSAYFRPIYSIFGFFFFFNYFLQLNISKKFFYYLIFNLALSFPAFYYVVILEINDWFQPYILRVNFFTIFSVTISIIFFYSLPFVILNFNKLKLILNDKIILPSSLIFLSLLFFVFNYHQPTHSGGIFYKFSILLFNNNYFFYIFSTISFCIIFFIFKIFYNKNYFLSDLIIFVNLVIMGIHGRIYHELYDPLFYILIFLLIKNDFYSNIINNLSKEKIKFIFIFVISFLIISIIKSNIYSLPYN